MTALPFLTPEDLDRLEELARAATPGKRTATTCDHDPDACAELRFEDGPDLLKTDGGMYPPEMPDARFIAACDVETALSLVAQARRAPRWIPVEERLPREFERVLVWPTGKRARVRIAHWERFMDDDDREWVLDRGGPMGPAPVCWMPLPAAVTI